MEPLFFELVSRGIAASLLVLPVVLLRRFFKRMPKWFRLVLWGFVAFRLVCPLSFESSFSLMPDVSRISEALEEKVLQEEDSVTTPENEQPLAGQQIQQTPMPYIWLMGILFMALYGVVSYFKVKRQIKASWNAKENIFYCDDIDTPSVFGLAKPGIYLPSGMEEATVEYVLRHEREHLRWGDQWWKLLGFSLLAVYWFHPLLWVAYVLFCKDIEFACDERVIKELGEGTRREYAQALLSCSIGKRIILLCPTAFGENGVKGRIRSVMTYKKATIPVLGFAVLACLVVGVLFLTDRKDAYGIEREHLTLETEALDEKLAERIAEDIAELMVESREDIYQLENFSFTFYELESEQEGRLLRVSVEADSTCLREPEDSPLIQGMKKAQAELTYEAEQSFAQRMIDSMLIQLKQEVETTICEPAIFAVLDEKNNYELYYGDANRTPLKDYFTKEDAEKEEFLGYLTVYQRAGIQPPVETAGSSGYIYLNALDNPENKLSRSDVRMSSMSLLASSLLYYRDGVFESIVKYEEKDAETLPWELLGEEIKTAYSNHGEYWSERDALLECTGNGTLYQVKGYEDTYRVAIVYEQNWRNDSYTGIDDLMTNRYSTKLFQSGIGQAKAEEIQPDKTTYHMLILERMNDLWFHEGREVFRQRMHLENAVFISGLSTNEELLWTFLAELFDAAFIHPASGSFPELAESEYQTLIFRDALGLAYSIALYEGGYVQETVNGTKLIARIDEELCRRVMERIEAYKTENYEVSYEGAIPVDGK